MSYDTWKTTEPAKFEEPEIEEKPCGPCGGTGLDEEGTTDRGFMLTKCDCCGGAGWV